ncbi:hypothetical protein AAAW47_000742 [Cronobacter sakazakii]|uniref:hypothetical protein n=1 Tax=Cronobacter sakazakii TaxID=28141 RepID=UPI000A19B2A3|nr:hypothetical protein [Cronobacter sakazakii]AXX00994.1 hypothetical protein CsakCS09_02915 [Cronobacter sakazakii]EJT6941311.1 hypothetical protein [Cronobacter sakazakii]EJT8242526.1 hypothetical protein [Cronobacter sakazakii]EJV9464873.1 hypothetical protein [Cronobacter sakazakii]EJV9506070.1 hypothetical protein [Cronobacter sakazakii]
MNNDELIAAGHELAKCLDSNTPLLDIAKLLSKMAAQLDVTTAALREKTKQCEQVAQAVGWVDGGNFTLAEAVAGNVSGLKAATQRSEELAAENAALKSKGRELLKEVCVVYEKYNASIDPENGNFMDGQTLHEFQFLMDCETPATDAFLREVRAQAIISALDSLDGLFDTDCVMETNGISYEEAEQRTTGALAVNNALIEFAAKLRQGGAA